MRPKSMVLVMIALGCGLVAAFAAFQVVGSQQGAAPAIDTVKVFVALTEIDIDDQLDSTNVQLEEWPKDRVPEGSISKLEDLEGKYAAQRLYKGEILLERKIIDPNDRNAKTLQIPDGYRVCTVKGEIDTANNGLVNPGDRVDVMVFLRKTSEVPVTGIRTILRDVRVFAVNSDTERAYDKEGNKVTAKTVSFLVKPDQAGKLLLASRLGVLQLALRRPDEVNDQDDTANITLESILEGSADIADEGANKKSEKPNGFADWMKNNAPQPPAPKAPPKAHHEMEIIYPDGAQTYSWSAKGKLPTMLSGDEPAYTAPATPPALPFDTSSSFDEDSDDDDDSDHGGDDDDDPQEDELLGEDNF